MILTVRLCSRSEFCLQDQEYDSWGAVADYVFQVVLISVSLTGHLTPLVEEFQRDICIDAPSRSGGDSRGGRYKHSELRVLTFKQHCEHDIPFLLAKNRPHIVVDESGG